MISEGQNEPFQFSEIIQNNKFNDVADKFRAYRLNAEVTESKLKEANTVIEQLKTEINILKDVETYLRSHITSDQNRLLLLQKTVTKILTLLGRIRQSEKASLEIEQKIGRIEESIQKIKQESQNIFSLTSNELNLMKNIEELKIKVKDKESEINLLKIENQMLSKQKQETEVQAEHKCEILQHDLEELRREKTEMQAQYEQTLQVYMKQIEDNELTINEYERERKSLLEEFAVPKSSGNSSDIALADSTVLLNPDNRSPSNSKSVKNSMDSEYYEERQAFSYSSAPASQTRPKQGSYKSKKDYKQKPQLEFLSSNCTPKMSSDAPPPPPPKRRLFSMNCNHYAN